MIKSPSKLKLELVMHLWLVESNKSNLATQLTNINEISQLSNTKLEFIKRYPQHCIETSAIKW